MRSALGADLGTFYDMDKATVTVIFAMTVEEVREHRAGVYYYSAAFSARAEGATSLLRSQDLEVWEDMSTRRREWWPIEEVLARGSMKGRDREVSARGGDTAARARVPYADTSHAGAPPRSLATKVVEAFLRTHRSHAPVKVPPLATSADPLPTSAAKSADVSSPACVIEEQERQQEGDPAGAAANHVASTNWYKPKVA